jgi:hypothetical protein
VKFTVAYYGDLMNELMVQANPELKKSLIWRNDKWFEPHQRDESHLEQLLLRANAKHTERDYKQLVSEFKNPRFLKEVARVLGPVGSFTGLTNYAINRLFPDFGAYLNSRMWASNIRARLQGRLKRALAQGDDIALISHSMGCVVSYDVLWKLSRMDEHRTVRDRKISLWLTLGCPLGARSIRTDLYDAYEPDDGLYPSNILDWINVAAHQDFVTHDGTVADDFHEMPPHLHVLGRLKGVESAQVLRLPQPPHGCSHIGEVDQPEVGRPFGVIVVFATQMLGDGYRE